MTSETAFPTIGREDLRLVEDNPRLVSFLYDLNLLPECLLSFHDVLPREKVLYAYGRFFGVLECYRFMTSGAVSREGIPA